MEEKEARKGAMTAAESGGKITYFVVASCVMAAMGGVIFGYDIGVSGFIKIYFIISDCFDPIHFFLYSRLKKKSIKRFFFHFFIKYYGRQSIH